MAPDTYHEFISPRKFARHMSPRFRSLGFCASPSGRDGKKRRTGQMGQAISLGRGVYILPFVFFCMSRAGRICANTITFFFFFRFPSCFVSTPYKCAYSFTIFRLGFVAFFSCSFFFSLYFCVVEAQILVDGRRSEGLFWKRYLHEPTISRVHKKHTRR